jgi:hypothetical protein
MTQTQEDLSRILKGPNAYRLNPVNGQMEYVTVTPVETEYPRAMFRKPTEDEIKARSEELSKEVWLDREFDLIQATGQNHAKKAEAWQAWVNRPVEAIVKSASEEKKLQAEGWTKFYVEALA